MQSCKKCGATKAPDAFYRSFPNECKDCTKARVRAYRERNIDRVKEYDRQRGQDEARKARNKQNYYKRVSTPEGRAAAWERAKLWRESTPEQRSARVALNNAVRDGKVERQPCTRCGETKANAHHEDYGKPLDVIWLCRNCHGARHREINAERRAGLRP